MSYIDNSLAKNLLLDKMNQLICCQKTDAIARNLEEVKKATYTMQPSLFERPETPA